jgi:flagella basal body P-ring formation protein FlgA
MTWCVSLIAAIALADSAAVPAGFARRVQEEVARLWQVDAGRLVLSWGSVSRGATFDEAASFRLAGRGERGWFVAVVQPEARPQFAVRVRVGRRDSVWVASHGLRRGQTIQGEDAQRTEQLVWDPPADADADPRGFEVTRDLEAGALLREPSVRPPVVIPAGTPVDFEIVRGRVRLVVRAAAQNAARQGEMVYAVDRSRGGRLQGIVTGPGQARLVERNGAP